jgi:ferrous iron transport protein B
MSKLTNYNYNVALIGNPNCGKTTIFNRLTGAQQKVGNWPGVTVEKKTGQYTHQQQNINITDLPGLYSISPAPQNNSVDQQITNNFIKNERLR